MTLRATCPKGHSLTLEERLAGKKIRCPRCQVVFQVPDLDEDEYADEDEDERISAKPLRRARRRDDDEEDEDEEDRPRARKRRPAPVEDDEEDDDDEEEMDPETRRKLDRQIKKKQLKLVDVGLLLHYIKLYVYVIGMLFGIGVVIMTLIAGAQNAERAVNAEQVAAGGDIVLLGFGLLVLVSFFLYLLLFLICPLLGVVGSFLCCWVPKKSEARGTIIISLTFDLINVFGWLLWLLASLRVFTSDTAKIDNLNFLLTCISYICLVASWLTFLTYLRSLGKYLGEPGVGNEGLNLIARLVVNVVQLIVLFIVATRASAFLLGGINVFLAIAIGILCVVIGTVFFIFSFFIRLIKLLSAMRRAVQNRL